MSTCCANFRIAVKSVLFIVAVTSVLLAITLPAQAQDSPREVRAKAQAALEKGAYSDAIGYLQQMIEWYGSSKKDAAMMQMEMIYFHLGTSYFFLGQFNEARAAFTVYLKEFRNGAKIEDATLYIADCYRFEERYGDALRAYSQALKRFSFQGGIRADVYMSIARCYLAQDKWDKAIPVLRKLCLLYTSDAADE